MKYFCLIILLSCSGVVLNAQSYSGSGNYNRLGLQGKVALFDIETSDFDLEGNTGFLAGFTTRGRLYNNFSMVYGLDILSASVNIDTQAGLGQAVEETKYNLLGAQLNILLSYDIIDQYLSVEAGPALLVNGGLRLKDEDQEDNIVSGYTTLSALDIEDISKVNAFGVVGISGGFNHVRFSLQYQYGFTNMFNGLNNEGLENIDAQANDFKGNASIISGGVVFYL